MSLRVFSVPVLGVVILFHALEGAAQDIQVLVSNAAGRVDPVVGSGYALRPVPHVDLNIIYDPTNETFRGGFRTAETVPITQFESEQAIAYLPASAARTRSNASSQYDFQGSMGDTYWVFPSSASSSNTAFALYLGLATYGVARNGTFQAETLNWSVESVQNLTTPAVSQFYGYAVTSGNVSMQLTTDPAYPSAQFSVLANDHKHLNLAFRATGMYRVTFRVRGTLVATGQEVSSLIPVYFGVETWQIPSGPVPATGYEAWKLALFSSMQAADPLVSGLDADPDGDGANNLVEYAFNGNPLIPGVAGKPQRESLTDGGQEYLAIRYQRRKGDTTLSTTVESTADLSATNWSGVGVQVGALTPVGTDYEEVVYRAPTSKANAVRQFMRVKVVKN